MRSHQLLGNTLLELTEANRWFVRRVQCTSYGISIVDGKVKKHCEDAHRNAFFSTLAGVCCAVSKPT
jgi:hypothetical protein